MAHFGIVHQFPGGSEAQYEASIAAAHPSDGSLPEGQLFHAAGPSADGWMIIAIHESKESWEQFRDGTLMPLLQAGIEKNPGLEHLPRMMDLAKDDDGRKVLEMFSGPSLIGRSLMAPPGLPTERVAELRHALRQEQGGHQVARGGRDGRPRCRSDVLRLPTRRDRGSTRR